MSEFLTQPWPWYVAGPLIGLLVPMLLLYGGKQFGISSNLRHLCAASYPGRFDFLKYDWRRSGLWNLTFLGGILIGGFIGGVLLRNPDPIAISQATVADLQALGIQDFTGYVPEDIFSWSNLLTPSGLIIILGGGFLVGFGARYAGGCTSGHAISGLADLQLPSLIAVIGFFAGGLIATHLLLPLIL
ncbi:MAG: YeeE/YedE family protein [Bacteroidetes bacterium]|nr:YeeE/YedE family protein [Rhodothermaceae bacterium RA]RMH49161.1 MAG: YeeE/YedE family protein [Bacteroidota bacterium]